jgi:hypothetical protein
MGRAIARISDIQLPASPRTTFKVGAVTGGRSVNSMPIEVSFELDLRGKAPRSRAICPRSPARPTLLNGVPVAVLTNH